MPFEARRRMTVEKELLLTLQGFPVYVNKGPTRCNSMQTFILCHVTLHVSGVMHPSSGVLKTVSANSGVRHAVKYRLKLLE